MTAVTDTSGSLAWLSAGSARVRSRLDVALLQQSSGRVSETLGGLGAAAQTSLNLRPSIGSVQTWQRNIDAVQSRMDTTLAVMTRIGDIANEFFARTAEVNQIGTSQISVLAAGARDALREVGDLLNTKVGDTYIFGGRDTHTAPLPSTDPDVTGAALRASDTADAPFSPSIGTDVLEVEVGDDMRVRTGVLANRNSMATSDAPTTGSFMRDVMRALANLATLPTATDPQGLAADTRVRLSSAITALGFEEGALGNVRAGLEARKTGLAATETTLQRQVSSVEDVDSAAILVKVSSLQTQLQASYQVIAGTRDLSLVKFL